MIEWRTGSLLALEEVGDIDGSIVEIEKGGRPRVYRRCRGA